MAADCGWNSCTTWITLCKPERSIVLGPVGICETFLSAGMAHEICAPFRGSDQIIADPETKNLTNFRRGQVVAKQNFPTDRNRNQSEAKNVST
jgi:hypothetical protein